MTIKTETKFPLISIVGRPNVGKSTLFNRLIKQKKSITDSMPGVTRDPVEAAYSIEGKNFLLMDTGGFMLEKEGLEFSVTKKSKESAVKSSLILLVIDAEEGLTSLDEEFIAFLRPFSDKIILVLNKVDNDRREANIWNYHALGFKKVVPLSAAHNLNIEELENEIMLFFAEHQAEEHEEIMPDLSIAILGKPNTGKSTLLNRLLDEDRALVSAMPGTTRDVIEGHFTYKNRRINVVDTAGIRRKGKVTDNVEYYSVNRAFKALEEADVVFLMIDCEEGVSDQDKKIADQIVKKGRGVILVLSKWDLMEHIKNSLDAVTDRTRFIFPALDFAPLLTVSALSGSGINKLLDTALEINKQLDTKIETAVLNRYLKRWEELYNPVVSSASRHRIKYMVQVSARPHRFVLFVNKKKSFPKSYIEYIKNKIRSELKLGSVPIDMEVKETS